MIAWHYLKYFDHLEIVFSQENHIQIGWNVNKNFTKTNESLESNINLIGCLSVIIRLHIIEKIVQIRKTLHLLTLTTQHHHVKR